MGSLKTILERIKMRNRHFEQNIDPHYLQTLIDSYHEYTTLLKQNHEDIPIIELCGDDLDFVKHPEDLEKIIKQIDAIIQQEA